LLAYNIPLYCAFSRSPSKSSNAFASASIAEPRSTSAHIDCSSLARSSRRFS
jgi:hypothetical protein